MLAPEDGRAVLRAGALFLGGEVPGNQEYRFGWGVVEGKPKGRRLLGESVYRQTVSQHPADASPSLRTVLDGLLFLRLGVHELLERERETEQTLRF